MKKPTQPDPVVNLNVRIPRDVRTAAKIAAAKQGKTLNAFVAQALVKAAALAAAMLLVGCAGASDLTTDDAGHTYGETRCFLHDVREPVACDAGPFTWTDDAGAYSCAEAPCAYGSACVVNGASGVCR